jgi:hypothetical protein
MHGEKGCAYFLFGKLNGETLFGNPTHRMVGNIKIDIQEKRWRTKSGLSASGR